MSDPAYPSESRPSLARAFRHMPGWKWRVMIIALVVGAIGAGAQLASKAMHKAQPAVQTTTVHTPAAASPGNAPPGSSGFVGGGGPSADTSTNTTTATTTTPAEPGTASKVTDAASPYLMQFGFSFVVGVILGVIVRTFLGFAAILTALVIAAAVALNYFHVINVDVAVVKEHAGEATSWIGQQLSHLKDVVFTYLPSAGSAGVGFLVGMKRR